MSPLRLAASTVLSSLALLAGLLFAPAALADGPYDGQWTMSALTESFTVQEWSAACGPAPVSGTLLSGGPVTVIGSAGELVITGRRPLRTDACLDPMPTLARVSHSQDPGGWRTRCATPSGDPRRAVVNTAYFASGDTITLAETGRYELTINDAHCVADVKRAGSLARVLTAPPATAAPVPPAATAAPAPTPAAPVVARDCSAPGAAARLEVRPSRKLLRLGDTFTFHASVFDASGCATGTPVDLTVGAVTFKDGQDRAARPSIDRSGLLTVPSQDFGDATFDVVATAGGRSARASVQVAVPADFDALLAASGLGASGELDTPAVTALATSSIGSTDASGQDGARARRLLFVAVVGTLAAGLGVLALFGVRRSRRVKDATAEAELRHADRMAEHERAKQEREARHASQMKAHLASVAVAQQQAAAAAARGIDTGPVFCPSCRREYPAGTAFCAYDSNRLVAVRDHAGLMGGPSGGICPVCRKGYNPGVKVCPDDGEALLPASVAPPPSERPRGKICPTCGARFDGGATFCGKDGTQLVLVN